MTTDPTAARVLSLIANHRLKSVSDSRFHPCTHYDAAGREAKHVWLRCQGRRGAFLTSTPHAVRQDRGSNDFRSLHYLCFALGLSSPKIRSATSLHRTTIGISRAHPETVGSVFTVFSRWALYPTTCELRDHASTHRTLSPRRVKLHQSHPLTGCLAATTRSTLPRRR